MISSLTGFGKITKQIGAKKISIEVKSRNSKSIDVNVKLSSCLKEKELDIRKLVAKELKRGKIELLIYSESIGKQTNYTLNKQLINCKFISVCLSIFFFNVFKSFSLSL